jgi:ribosome maturation factor RimP
VTGHQPQQALLEVLEEPLARSGLDLEAVEMASAGRRSLVRVLVDQDGGVTLDDIAEATHLVSEVLDESEVLGDAPYTLEVTSPGTDRPLTLPRHWRRNLDRLVKVTTRDGDTFTGRVMQTEDEGAVLDVDGTKRDVVYADVAMARVQIEFSRPSGTTSSAPDDDVEKG